MCEYVYIRSSVSGFNAKQILLLNYDLEVYGLANIKSAKKRVITSQVRAERNKAVKSRVKTYIKKVEAAVAAKDTEAAKAALHTAIVEISKAGTKGVYHKKTVSRKIARLSKAVDAIA
jgi:small subunit ribosomal protein S20